jgi:hypothetical protein
MKHADCGGALKRKTHNSLGRWICEGCGKELDFGKNESAHITDDRKKRFGGDTPGRHRYGSRRNDYRA